MPVQLPHVDWTTIAPEGILFVGGLVLLLAGVFVGRRAPRGLCSVATVGVALLAPWPAFHLWHQINGGHARPAVANAVIIDGFAVFFFLLVGSTVLLCALLA